MVTVSFANSFSQIENYGEHCVVEQSEAVNQDHPTIEETKIKKKMSVEEAFADWLGQGVFFEDPDTPTIEEWGDLI